MRDQQHDNKEGARNLERLNGGPIHLLILIKING